MAKKLLITADGEGSNRHSLKLWKPELQTFANETKMELLFVIFLLEQVNGIK